MHQVGPYRVVRPLGMGGMGMVFEVLHPSASRPLALKLLKRGVSETTLERFRREAEVLAKVRHPNVVVVHELGQCPQGPYLVTDLVEGRPLADLVREGGVKRPRQAAKSSALWPTRCVPSTRAGSCIAISSPTT